MARCPLCSQRAGKRYCPAKEAQICAVCCGEKREVEIDCPGSCIHLKAGRSYEAEKRVPDRNLLAGMDKYDNAFVHRFSPVLDMVSRAVVEERMQSSWLVDNDVIEVYKSLSLTMKTLSSGIYYESLPEGPLRIFLFRRLKTLFDELMQPNPSVDQRSLKVSEALEVLDFLRFAAEVNSSVRPRSRRYLDWLTGMAQLAVPPENSSGLIIP